MKEINKISNLMTEINLNTIVSITEIPIFIIILILTIFILKAVKKFADSVSRIENELMKISEQISPVINEMDYISHEFRILTDKTKLKYAKVEFVADTLIDKSFGVLNLINKFHRFSNGYLQNTINLISAVSAGIKTFRKN